MILKQKINLGILGLGTVGSSLVKILMQKNVEFKQNYGVEFNIKKIAVRKINAPRRVAVPANLLTDNPKEITNDPNIDIVIELMGGISPAKEIILQALGNKKNVITANKHLLAGYIDKLISEAKEKGCYFGFRAALTGCHQILNHLAHGSSVNSIIGIFNGTCNYILTEMENNRRSFREVLLQAQEYGYAEADPSMDIEGKDTADKIIIIARLVFGVLIKPNDFYIEGINNIDIDDIQSVGELGYRIKLLGILKRDNNKLEVRVHPCLVPKEKTIGSLMGVRNGIQINDELKGPNGLYADGAGGNPTAMAIIADLINMLEKSVVPWSKQSRKLTIKPMKMVRCKYYIRISAVNRPGVLSRVSSILGKHSINIKSVIQKGEKPGIVVPLIIVTDEAFEKDIQGAVILINKLDVIKGVSKIIRIEENVE